MGRSRGGFSSKLHPACDALGNPRRFLLTPGQDSDHGQAPGLLGDDEPGAVIGDKGYDSKAFAEFIEQRKAVVVIPSRSNAKQPEA